MAKRQEKTRLPKDAALILTRLSSKSSHVFNVQFVEALFVRFMSDVRGRGEREAITETRRMPVLSPVANTICLVGSILVRVFRAKVTNVDSFCFFRGNSSSHGKQVLHKWRRRVNRIPDIQLIFSLNHVTLSFSESVLSEATFIPSLYHSRQETSPV